MIGIQLCTIIIFAITNISRYPVHTQQNCFTCTCLPVYICMCLLSACMFVCTCVVCVCLCVCMCGGEEGGCVGVMWVCVCMMCVYASKYTTIWHY